uniref:Uncharacterized protein n=1 Tax=Globodera rostochiensis TaxID=31243 RepID=A0A914HGC7_GLORO
MDTSDNEIGTTKNSNWVGHLEVFVGEEQKFKLVTTDFVRFRFLAHRFQLVPLQDQPIQILLQLDPNEICSVVAGDEQHLIPAMNSFNSCPAKTEQRPTKTNVDNKCRHNEDGLSEIIAKIRTSLAKLDERQTAGEELDYDLNLRQKDARPDEEVHHAYSSGDEHVQLMRERLRDEFAKRQKHQKKKPLISADSTSAYDGGPNSLSASRTSRSSGSSCTRTNRRRTSSNKMMRTNKKPSSASSSAAGHRNEEPSDDQLMDEMDTIGRRLDWIRQQFQQRTVVEQHIDGDGTPSLSEDAKIDNQRQVEAIGPNTEEQPQSGNSSKSTSTEPRRLESGSLETEKLKARRPNKCENGVIGIVKFENAGPGGTEYGTAQVGKNAEEGGMATSGTAEYSATGMARFENAESGMPKLGTYVLMPENAETEMPNSENAEFGMVATLKLAEPGKQSPVLAFETIAEASCRSEVRQTPPSSAGYHSSRPSTSKTYDIYADNVGHNEAGHNANNNIFENWQNANVQTMPPPAVERMDFSGLRSSEEEEVEDANLNVPKKPKRRLWKEIEVFPRNSPTKVANPPANATSECSKAMPKSSGRRDVRSGTEKPSGTEDAAQTAPRRSPWRRPQWLRLLPPFDGTIRTERQTAQIQLERPLLVLKLDELYTTPRGPEDAVETGGCTLTHPTRRRTFLELAAKMERMRRSQNSGTKVEQQQQQQPQTSGTYDSGIGLDQQHQQHNNNNNNNICNNNNGMTGNGVVLYSVELDEADVEAMRRRAGSDR